MVLKIWDDRENSEGWIWFDHVRAVKLEDNQRHCVARSLKDDEFTARIYGMTDDSKIDRDHMFPSDDGDLFGTWMFSGARTVREFSDDEYVSVRLLNVLHESGDEQVLILQQGHPSCYLLSDSGKTIERI